MPVPWPLPSHESPDGRGLTHELMGYDVMWDIDLAGAFRGLIVLGLAIGIVVGVAVAVVVPWVYNHVAIQ